MRRILQRQEIRSKRAIVDAASFLNRATRNNFGKAEGREFFVKLKKTITLTEEGGEEGVERAGGSALESLGEEGKEKAEEEESKLDSKSVNGDYDLEGANQVDRGLHPFAST